MAKATLEIESILGGRAPSKYFVGDFQYQAGIAIDPDYPIGSEIMTSGAIVPTVYEKFSSTEVDSYPMWLITTTKNSNIYAYLANGKFVSYDSALANPASIGTPTSGAGNGGAYYNNYIYLSTPTDVSRYGPLNGSPSLANTFWTITLSLTALTNTTYPTIRGVSLPNHVMHPHNNGVLYIADFKDGQGLIHTLSTKKVTVEGDSNDTVIPSAYNSLDLPYGYYPTCFASYNTDLVIGAIQTTNSSVMQGKAALFFWDTTSSSFYRQVPIDDPYISGLQNVNGVLHLFSGSGQNGMRISQYLGGDSIAEIAFLEEGNTPFPGAIEAIASRIFFGTWTTYPATTGSVFSFGSKKSSLPQSFHNVIRTTSAGANPVVTAIRRFDQDSNVKAKLVVGWGNDSAKGIDKISTSGTYNSTIRFPWFNIGKKFRIEKIQIPLAVAVAANMSVTPKIYVDDEVTTAHQTLTEINNTNYSGKKNVIYKNPQLTANGEHNFMLELNFAGSVACPVTFPILIFVDIRDDE